MWSPKTSFYPDRVCRIPLVQRLPKQSDANNGKVITTLSIGDRVVDAVAFDAEKQAYLRIER
jgi:hypothetical protein